VTLRKTTKLSRGTTVLTVCTCPAGRFVGSSSGTPREVYA